MKTSIDIAHRQLLQARRVAAAEGITVCELVHVGPRSVLPRRHVRSAPFQLQRASFKGKGLQPEMHGACAFNTARPSGGPPTATSAASQA